MTISGITLKDNGSTTTDGASITTTSITWTGGARGLVIAFARRVSGTATPGTPTISGWTQITGADVVDASTLPVRATVFYLDSPSNGTLTITWPETQGAMAYHVIEIAAGYDTGAPPAQAVATGQGTGTTPTATLGGSPAAASALFQISTANGSPTVTLPSGYTLLHRDTASTPSLMGYSSYKNGSAATTADPTYSTSQTWAQMLVEIAAASAAVVKPPHRGYPRGLMRGVRK